MEISMASLLEYSIFDFLKNHWNDECPCFGHYLETITGELKRKKSDRSLNVWPGSTLEWPRNSEANSVFWSLFFFFFLIAAVTKHRKLGVLKTTLIYSLRVLEVRSSKFKVLVRLRSFWRLLAFSKTPLTVQGPWRLSVDLTSVSIDKSPYTLSCLPLNL